MSSFASDFLYAFRIFYKRPGLTLLSILALSISLGLSTTTFSVLNGVFLKPIPFEKPDQLHQVYLQNTKADIPMLPVPKEELSSLREVDAFSGYLGFYVGTVNLSGSGKPERYNGAYVTPNFLEVLGKEPVLGRTFSPDAGKVGGPEEILISWDVWSSRYKENPEVVGSRIRVNGRQHEVVGVLPKGFYFPNHEYAWLPIPTNEATEAPPANTGTPVFGSYEDGTVVRPPGGTEPMHVQVIARTVDGVDPESIHRDLDAAFQGWASNSVEEKEVLELISKPLGFVQWNTASQSLFLVMIGAVMFILLVSCANVANLLVGRALSRGREMAIRSALGATRRRVLRQLLTESLVLALFGTVGGLIYAAWAVDSTLKGNVLSFPYWINFELDWRVFLFALLIMLGTTFISGFVPAWQSSKIDLNEMLKDTSHTSTSFRLGRLTRLLAVVQIAFSCALLFGAGLVTRNVLQMSNLEPGFDAETVLTMRMGLFPEDYPTETNRDQFYAQLAENVRNIPGVDGSAVSSWLGQYGNYMEPFLLSGTGQPNEGVSYAYIESVSPGYFNALDMQRVSGVLFDNESGETLASGVVVNETFVSKFLKGTDPLGQEVSLFSEKQQIAEENVQGLKIVGVVSDVRVSRYDKTESSEPIIYLPYTLTPSPFMSLLVRSESVEMTELEEAIIGVIGRLDPHLPVYFTKTFQDHINEQILPYRMLANFLLYIGLMALFLAAIGVYGMIAFNVTRRSREIGIRMALGANSRKIVTQVLQQGFVQVALGILVGSMLAFLVGQLTRNFLLGINPTDPSVFLGVLLTLVGVAILAFFIPARRAARLSPMDALRCE